MSTNSCVATCRTGRSRIKIFDASGAYKVDWWSPEPGEEWQQVERGVFDEIEEPSEVSFRNSLVEGSVSDRSL
jgi:hypothetical protein